MCALPKRKVYLPYDERLCVSAGLELGPSAQAEGQPSAGAEAGAGGTAAGRRCMNVGRCSISVIQGFKGANYLDRAVYPRRAVSLQVVQDSGTQQQVSYT
jgi:hypothetical protein